MPRVLPGMQWSAPAQTSVAESGQGAHAPSSATWNLCSPTGLIRKYARDSGLWGREEFLTPNLTA